jgi:hypothetical protein
MPRVFIEWDEIHEGDLPRRCMSCGRRADDLVVLRLTTVLYSGLVRSTTEWVTVELPLCDDHADRSPGPEGRLAARRFYDTGVELINVCDEFIDALEDHRDGLDQPKRFRGGSRERKRRRDDVEEKVRFPRRAPPPKPSSGVGGVVVVAILAVLGVCTFFCCIGVFLNRPRQPAPVRQFGPPPFGPPGR